jgi:hypothetical protein
MNRQARFDGQAQPDTPRHHLTANFAATGVLDELRIMVYPIAIGQGRSLFADLKGRLAFRLGCLRHSTPVRSCLPTDRRF